MPSQLVSRADLGSDARLKARRSCEAVEEFQTAAELAQPTLARLRASTIDATAAPPSAMASVKCAISAAAAQPCGRGFGDVLRRRRGRSHV